MIEWTIDTISGERSFLFSKCRILERIASKCAAQQPWSRFSVAYDQVRSDAAPYLRMLVAPIFGIKNASCTGYCGQTLVKLALHKFMFGDF